MWWSRFPRWAFEKFPGVDRVLGPQMKSVGEAMAIGRTFKEALQKAIRSLEIGTRWPWPAKRDARQHQRLGAEHERARPAAHPRIATASLPSTRRWRRATARPPVCQSRALIPGLWRRLARSWLSKTALSAQDLDAYTLRRAKRMA